MKYTNAIEQQITYDGTQLSSLWAYKNFGLQGDSIVAFRGPCHVKLDKMVDLADVLAEEHIYSEEMLHFIIEHFDMDLEKTVIRQRLLIAIIRELLEEALGIKLTRDGDDLFLGDGKLSVSIATLSPVSTMIHTGLNVSSANTPVQTVSLADLGVKDIHAFADKVLTAYTAETESIRMARCKVRGVE